MPSKNYSFRVDKGRYPSLARILDEWGANEQINRSDRITEALMDYLQIDERERLGQPSRDELHRLELAFRAIVPILARSLSDSIIASIQAQGIVIDASQHETIRSRAINDYDKELDDSLASFFSGFTSESIPDIQDIDED